MTQQGDVNNINVNGNIDNSLNAKVKEVANNGGLNTEVKEVAKNSDINVEVLEVANTNGLNAEVKEVANNGGQNTEVKEVAKNGGINVEVLEVANTNGLNAEVKGVANNGGQNAEVKEVANTGGINANTNSLNAEVKEVANTGGINADGKVPVVNNGANSELKYLIRKDTEINDHNVLHSDRSQTIRESVIKSPYVVNQLKNLGRAGAQKQAEPNPYLDEFLSKHSKPVIEIEEESDLKLAHFYLNLDKRYRFRPNVRLAPFRSFAAPWPMPQEYSSNPETVFHINPVTFQIMIMNRTSDILREAIKRYTEIIMKRSLEEPYSFVNNFHESFAKYNTDDPKKYARTQSLPQLSVYVSGSDVGYPQLNGDETCK